MLLEFGDLEGGEFDMELLALLEELTHEPGRYAGRFTTDVRSGRTV